MPENTAADPLLAPTPPAGPAAVPAVPEAVKLCLVIIFNHRFEANLPKLDWVYRDRFRHIRYLVPFYRGDRPDVIPVYNSSFQFQGFFREAWQRLRGEGFTHFLFCADDMVLNPRLNEENFLAELGLDAHTGYSKFLTPLSSQRLEWFAAPAGLVTVAGKNGVNWERELPSRELAAANLRAKGHQIGRLGWESVRHGFHPKGFFQFLFYLALRWKATRRQPTESLLDLPYPLLCGQSDLLVVPAAYMEKFTWYCTVFAAMGLFVEIGSPTALALACPRTICENDTTWRALDHWGGDDARYEAYCLERGYQLDRLLAGMEEKLLCIHPIKFSQWTAPVPAAR